MVCEIPFFQTRTNNPNAPENNTIRIRSTTGPVTWFGMKHNSEGNYNATSAYSRHRNKGACICRSCAELKKCPPWETHSAPLPVCDWFRRLKVKHKLMRDFGTRLFWAMKLPGEGDGSYFSFPGAPFFWLRDAPVLFQIGSGGEFVHSRENTKEAFASTLDEKFFSAIFQTPDASCTNLNPQAPTHAHISTQSHPWKHTHTHTHTELLEEEDLCPGTHTHAHTHTHRRTLLCLNLVPNASDMSLTSCSKDWTPQRLSRRRTETRGTTPPRSTVTTTCGERGTVITRVLATPRERERREREGGERD